jgi:hypothetical protein
MFKAIILGFTATTNMVLVGVGGALAGAAALAAAQAIRNPRTAVVEPSPIVQPGR